MKTVSLIYSPLVQLCYREVNEQMLDKEIILYATDDDEDISFDELVEGFEATR